MYHKGAGKALEESCEGRGVREKSVRERAREKEYWE